MEADVLSQEEVDALLTGVEDEPASATETGPAVAEPPSAPPPEVAEPAIPPLAPGEEVDPLLAAFPELFAPPAEEAPVAPGELSIDPWLLGFSEIVEAETRAHAAAVAASSTPVSSTPAAPAPAPGQAARGPRHGREELTVTATLTRSDLARASQTEALKMPGLERVAENLVPLLARAMRRLLRRDVTVSGEPIVFTNWEQALADAGRAKLLRLGMAPLPGQAAVAFSDELVDILVEHLFGSNGRLYRAPGEAPRPPGHTETRIAARLLDYLRDAWRDAWTPVFPLTPSADGALSEPGLFAAQHDAVLGFTLTLNLGERSGQIRILLPYDVTQPIHELLRAGLVAPTRVPAGEWTRKLLRGVESAEVELAADLGSADVTLRQVLAMRPGDFIPLVVPSTLVANVDDEPLLECQYGVSNGQYALRIERVLTQVRDETGESHD